MIDPHRPVQSSLVDILCARRARRSEPAAAAFEALEPRLLLSSTTTDPLEQVQDTEGVTHPTTAITFADYLEGDPAHEDHESAVSGDSGEGVTLPFVLAGWKWPDFRIPVNYYVNTTNLQDGISAAEFVDAVDSAFQAWQDVPTSYIAFNKIGSGSQYGVGSADGVTTVGFGTAVPGALAHATTYTDGSGVTEFDVVLGDDRAVWSTGSIGGSEVDVWATSAHEIGHGIGLGHTSDANATMYCCIYIGSTFQRFPNPDDVAGISDLYPSSGQNEAPPTPGALSASSIEQDRATVLWGASTDPDGDSVSYEVQHRRTGTTTWSSAATTSGLSRTITGLLQNTSYDVRVRASDGQLQSSYRQANGLFTTAAPLPPDVVDFSATPLLSYGGGGQDVTGTVTVEAGGGGLRLEGNRWKAISFNYNITANTVLEFDFSSDARGEVHSIGLDVDLSLNSPGSFQLYGTQTFAVQDFNDYAGSAPGTKRYSIPVGQYTTGQVIYLVFGNDHDLPIPTARSLFSNVRVYEDLPPPPGPAGAIDFSAVAVGSYGGQDGVGTASVESAGALLRLTGNTWKQIPLSYNITPDTIIEFDFRSPSQAEVHGIAFDDDAAYTPLATFQVYGTQTWQIQDFRDYGAASPDFKHYSIPVGQYLTGQVNHLVFINDHDVAGATSQGVFANVYVHEPAPPPSGPFTVDFFNMPVGSYGGSQDGSGTASIEDAGATLHLTGNTWKKIDIDYTVTADTILEFEFHSPVRGEVHAIGVDTNTVIGSEASFQLYGTQTWQIQDHDDYAAGAPAVKLYHIRLGDYYTGHASHLFFGNDHDVPNATGESFFTNVRVFEDVPQTQGTIDFSAVLVGSYGGGYDGNGTVAVENLGARLHLTGNAWRQIAFSYNITTDTVLEFDFASPNQAEVHAVGFDDDTSYAPLAIFQIHGTQIWQNQDFHDYGAASPNFKHYKIPVGQYMTGQVNHLVFLNDHDAPPKDGEGLFGNVQVYEDVTPPGALTVHFGTVSVDAYGGGQDVNGSASIEDGGATLHLTGNTWKHVNIDYTITADTILEFDFSSSNEGEVHAIGFDDDGTYSPLASFQVHGTQNWRTQDFHDYAGTAPNLKHYQISVGQYLTGQVNQLVFINDHDVASADGEGIFSNVLLYEDVPPPGALTVDFGTTPVDAYGGGQDVNGSATVENGGATLHLTGNTWKQIDLDYTITADTILEFDFASSNEAEVSAIGFDDDGTYSPLASFQVYGTQNWRIQDFHDYAATAPNLKHYQISVGQYLTGQVNQLVFINDHDVPNPLGESFFTNVRIYEQTS